MTATLVSFARAVVTRPNAQSACADPIAPRLLPGPISLVVRGLNRLGPLRPFAEASVRAAFGGLVTHIELRTAAIDRALRAALLRGVDQVAILGAGLDGRAFRIPELGRAVVFEVDRPGLQARKRKRLGALSPTAKEVRFCACDFGHQKVGEVLAANGHDPARPTFFIWEGVTMYLPHQATEATLADVAARAAVGSQLAVTYLAPQVIGLSALGPILRVGLRGAREGLRGIYAPHAFADALMRNGFLVEDDFAPLERSKQLSGRRRRMGPFCPAERLVLAQRVGR